MDVVEGQQSQMKEQVSRFACRKHSLPSSCQQSLSSSRPGAGPRRRAGLASESVHSVPDRSQMHDRAVSLLEALKEPTPEKMEALQLEGAGKGQASEEAPPSLLFFGAFLRLSFLLLGHPAV